MTTIIVTYGEGLSRLQGMNFVGPHITRQQAWPWRVTLLSPQSVPFKSCSLVLSPLPWALEPILVFLLFVPLLPLAVLLTSRHSPASSHLHWSRIEWGDPPGSCQGPHLVPGTRSSWNKSEVQHQSLSFLRVTDSP